MNPKHPIQPLVMSDLGTLRFKENKIVSYLVDFARERGTSLNELAMMGFSKEDWTQLAQLIGYSLGGFGDLSYVDDDTYNTAEAMHTEGLTEKDARIAYLEAHLTEVKKSLEPLANLFGMYSE